MTARAQDVDTRQAMLRLGLFAVMQHMLDHELPAPMDTYITHVGGHDEIHVLVSGAGQQQRWLNTLAIVSETQEPSGLGRMRMAWMVALDCGIRFELVGHRAGDDLPRDLTLVPTGAAS